MARRFLLLATAPLLLCLLAARPSAGAPAAVSARQVSAPPSGATQVGDLAMITFTYWSDFSCPRCVRSITGLRLDTNTAVAGQYAGKGMLSSLRATPNLEIVVAGFGKIYNPLGAFDDPGGFAALGAAPGAAAADPTKSSVYVMRRRGDGVDQWDVATTVVGPEFHHGIEIMSDGDTLLVATVGKGYGLEVTPPYRVEKYSLAELTHIPTAPDRPGTHRLGPNHGAVELAEPAVAILRDLDGRHAHILTKSPPNLRQYTEPSRLAVITVDVATMAESAAPIALPDWAGWVTEGGLPMAALSPDGRHMVTTAGLQPTVNVVDLVDRRTWPVTIPDAGEVSDVAFSHGAHNHGLLALNVRRRVDRQTTESRVVTGDLRGGGIDVLSNGPVSKGNADRQPSPLDWTVDGRTVVAGVDRDYLRREGVPLVLMAIDDEGRRLTKLRDLLVCPPIDPIAPTWPMDILTANGLAQPTPTPPPTPTASPPPTLTATPPPTATTTPVPASPTPTVTPAPRPVYLPVLVRDVCTPELRRTDLVLVIDASTTMLEHTRAGRTKIDAAVEAAWTLAGDLDAGRDRLGLVWFNDAAHLELAPTFDRAAFQAALGRIQVRELTRIELGLAAAHAALTGASRRPGAMPVIMLLTDGRADPGPESLAVDAAGAAKADGITLFTLGIGDRIDAASLQAMATSPAHYVHAPDGEDLPAAYAMVRDALPCPAPVWP